MDNQTFNKEKRQLNKSYFDVFGEVPCMQSFVCSREEYLEALKEAIRSKTKVENLLARFGKPQNKNSLT